MNNYERNLLLTIASLLQTHLSDAGMPIPDFRATLADLRRLEAAMRPFLDPAIRNLSDPVPVQE